MARTSNAPTPSPEQAKLIDALGGPSAVARLVSNHLGRKDDEQMAPQTVCQWKKRGIPFCYRACLAIAARNRDIGVPPGFLGEQAKG